MEVGVSGASGVHAAAAVVQELRHHLETAPHLREFETLYKTTVIISMHCVCTYVRPGIQCTVQGHFYCVLQLICYELLLNILAVHYCQSIVFNYGGV